MVQRVLLIVVGGVLYYVLREYDLPRSLSALLALAPFAVAESRGLLPGPYEKSARDVMHETDEPKPSE